MGTHNPIRILWEYVPGAPPFNKVWPHLPMVSLDWSFQWCTTVLVVDSVVHFNPKSLIVQIKFQAVYNQNERLNQRHYRTVGRAALQHSRVALPPRVYFSFRKPHCYWMKSSRKNGKKKWGGSPLPKQTNCQIVVVYNVVSHGSYVQIGPITTNKY